MRPSRTLAALTILAALVFASSFAFPHYNASAASSTDFTNANAAISSAYASVYAAQTANHADVSNLAGQLNAATQLVNKAYQENSTDPTQATTDLQNAVTIAQQVSREVAGVSATGIKLHDLESTESLGVAITIVAVAGLIYAASDAVYRNWWVRTHGDYLVRLLRKSESK